MEFIDKIGAALIVEYLPQHIDFLVENQRDLEIQDPAIPNFPDIYSNKFIKQINGILKNHKGRRGIHGPFIGFSLEGFIEPEIGKAIKNRMIQSIHFASEIGAEYMVIHSPFGYFGTNPFSTVNSMMNPLNEFMFAKQLIEEIIQEAEKVKCVIVVENIRDKNPELLKNFVASFKSEYIRMSLDIGHAFITQKEVGPTPDQWILHSGELLDHIHIQDTDGETDRHWAPGLGNINWFAFFDALKTLEHMPHMVLELKDYTKIESGFSHLQTVWNKNFN
ncbi:MAG: sugar phosphate isomerase/epimerase [Spirochaetales bacterium]|nr:sugar phosphate isomerase/epimerase [Spirochaetales bacterium]